MDVGENMFISRYSCGFGVVFRERCSDASTKVSAAFANFSPLSFSNFWARLARASAGGAAVIPKNYAETTRVSRDEHVLTDIHVNNGPDIT